MKQPSRDGRHFVFDILFLFMAETCVYRLVHGCINFIYHRIELFDWTFFARRELCLYLCIRNKKQNDVSDVISQTN